jgi:hypothetical protein
MTTAPHALIARLAPATAHNHATEQAPVAVPWTDGDRKWELAPLALSERLPSMWTLAAHDPAANQQPTAGTKSGLSYVDPCRSASAASKTETRDQTDPSAEPPTGRRGEDHVRGWQKKMKSAKNLSSSVQRSPVPRTCVTKNKPPLPDKPVAREEV